jgi:hypothetical protein
MSLDGQEPAKAILERIRAKLGSGFAGSASPDRAENVQALRKRIRQKLQNVNAPTVVSAEARRGRQNPLPPATSSDLAKMWRQVEAAQAAHSQFGQVNPRLPGLHNRAIQSVKQAMRRSLTWYTRPLQQHQASVIQALQHATRVLQAHDRVLQGEPANESSALHELTRQNADLQKQLEAQRAELSALRDELRRALGVPDAAVSAEGRDTR